MVDDNGRTDGGRTPDHGHPISSPCEPNGSRELITKISLHTFTLKVNKNFRLHKKYTRTCCESLLDKICPSFLYKGITPTMLLAILT